MEYFLKDNEIEFKVESDCQYYGGCEKIIMPIGGKPKMRDALFELGFESFTITAYKAVEKKCSGYTDIEKVPIASLNGNLYQNDDDFLMNCDDYSQDDYELAEAVTLPDQNLDDDEDEAEFNGEDNGDEYLDDKDLAFGHILEQFCRPSGDEGPVPCIAIIDELYVDPFYRGKGIAKAMLQNVCWMLENHMDSSSYSDGSYNIRAVLAMAYAGEVNFKTASDDEIKARRDKARGLCKKAGYESINPAVDPYLMYFTRWNNTDMVYNSESHT